MKIAIASDHGGYQLKEEIKKYLEGRNIEVVDLGTNSEESVDYPIYGKACGEAVMSGTADRGIVCCGTGIGISIASGWTLNLRAAAIREEWTCSTHKTAPHALACFRRKTGRREGMTGGAGFA